MLQKQPININFSQGLNLKSDDKQVQLGQFLSLENSIFNKAGLLQKRNGFGALTPLPNTSSSYITTFTGGLTALGDTLQSYSQGSNQWIDKGNLQLGSLSTLQLVRSSTNQTQADSVVAPNNLVCTAYTNVLPTGTIYQYSISDSVTGEVVIVPTTLTAASGSINSSPRVFLLINNFIIAFGTSSNHIQYISIPIYNPTLPTTPVDLTSSYSGASTVAWDGIVVGNNLYFAYNTTGGGQAVDVGYLSSNGSIAASSVFLGEIATMMSLSVDLSNPVNPQIYVSYYDAVSQVGKSLIINTILATVLGPTLIIAEPGVLNLTTTAFDNAMNVYYEVSNSYPWGPASHYIAHKAMSSGGSVVAGPNIERSVGLASKAFTINSVDYMLVAFGSTAQPSYFLIDGAGNIVSRLSYSNGGGYLTAGLPSVTVTGTLAQIAYLRKDLISAINKNTNVDTSTTPISAVYSQTGVNLVSIDLNPSTITSVEIGGTLNISGAMPWSYDGVIPVEQGFNVYPDDINVTTATGSGSIAADTYYYQVTYEWADNNGNVNRSAPSIPVMVVTTTASSTNTIKVPNLRLTYKTEVKIVVYRWSTSQQVYYALLSPAVAPVLSSTTSDYTTITDTLANSSILGNPILYTTGGVIEDIQAPASNLLALFNNRLFMVDAEDPNLLWYSKQVIEATPVEMSDLLTEYIAPTTGAQGSTGPITAIAPMDDKLITFKKDAAYYINGIGPDNTGANNQYSDAIFISSVVGCSNQNSIVFIPNGLMFQSDKGIWLLGRDLSTNYIGAPVETLTQNALVKSALAVPGTNQVRFTMDSGITLMYDYYFSQWGTFTNIPGVSSTLYNSLHTYINEAGAVYQETLGLYRDHNTPVLMQFTTGWGNLAGLQGYERLYFMYLLGQYITPFTLNVDIAYDYDSNTKQTIIVNPNSYNYAPTFGSDALFGSGTPFGGAESNVFEARVFPKQQKCESFQVSVQEVYDPSYGVTAGAGLTLSGLNLVVGAKRGFRTQRAARSFG